MNNFNNLTEAQTERLALLSEECGEVVQVIGKILRHGFDRHNPNDALSQSNRSLLCNELGHVMFAVSMLTSSGDIYSPDIGRSHQSKCDKIKKYLHHQDYMEK